jgi:hypothetical protein
MGGAESKAGDPIEAFSSLGIVRGATCLLCPPPFLPANAAPTHRTRQPLPHTAVVHTWGVRKLQLILPHWQVALPDGHSEGGSAFGASVGADGVVDAPVRVLDGIFLGTMSTCSDHAM